MISNHDILRLMERNFCIHFEIDRSHHECKDCDQLGPCKMMETSIRDILAKKEKHDQGFVEKFKNK